jgi:hypothetical protein
VKALGNLGSHTAGDDNGLAVFDLIRGHGRNGSALLCAFDLLEVNGEDLRPRPIAGIPPEVKEKLFLTRRECKAGFRTSGEAQ